MKFFAKRFSAILLIAALCISLTAHAENVYYALATQKLATRTGPGTEYDEPGTFQVKGEWIRILCKAYDENGVCWVKCEIPYGGHYVTAWTGWKRFDPSTLDINTVPYEGQEAPRVTAAPVYGGQYALTTDKLATRDGPGTQYNGMGTYSVKGQWIKVLSKAVDSGNVMWVKCEIPYAGKTVIAWTGWKRFDHSTLDIDTVPYEGQEAPRVTAAPTAADRRRQAAYLQLLQNFSSEIGLAEKNLRSGLMTDMHNPQTVLLADLDGDGQEELAFTAEYGIDLEKEMDAKGFDLRTVLYIYTWRNGAAVMSFARILDSMIYSGGTYEIAEWAGELFLRQSFDMNRQAVQLERLTAAGNGELKADEIMRYAYYYDMSLDDMPRVDEYYLLGGSASDYNTCMGFDEDYLVEKRALLSGSEASPYAMTWTEAVSRLSGR